MSNVNIHSMPSPQGKVWNASVWQPEVVSTCQKQIEHSNSCPRPWSLSQFAYINHGSMCVTPEAANIPTPSRNALQHWLAWLRCGVLTRQEGPALMVFQLIIHLFRAPAAEPWNPAKQLLVTACGRRSGPHSSRAGYPVSSIQDNRPHVSDWPRRVFFTLNRWVF